MFPFLILLLTTLLVSSCVGFGQSLDQIAQALLGAYSTPTAVTDTDGDGLGDGFESKYGLNRLTDDSNANGLLDPAENPDGDGLSNLGEQRFSTNPKNADSDGDGVTDGAEDSNQNGIADAIEQDQRAVPFPIDPALSKASTDYYCSMPGSGSPCVGDPAGTKTIALYGDSHAAQWLPALDIAGKARHWRAKLFAKAHCPSVHVPQGGPACAAARASAEQKMQADPPDLVIVSNFSHYGTPIDTWIRGLGEMLAALPSTSRVVVLADTPFFRHDTPACLRNHPTDIGFCEVPREIAFRTVLDQKQAQTASAAGARFLSMNAWVCPYGLCPVIVGHKLLWRDSHHMTVTYSRQLAPAFGKLVAAALG
jgi:hypothetical protein